MVFLERVKNYDEELNAIKNKNSAESGVSWLTSEKT